MTNKAPIYSHEMYPNMCIISPPGSNISTTLAFSQAEFTAGVRCCVTAALSDIHPLNYDKKKGELWNVS